MHCYNKTQFAVKPTGRRITTAAAGDSRTPPFFAKKKINYSEREVVSRLPTPKCRRP
jgi:hypothetical protein